MRASWFKRPTTSWYIDRKLINYPLHEFVLLIYHNFGKRPQRHLRGVPPPRENRQVCVGCHFLRLIEVLEEQLYRVLLDVVVPNYVVQEDLPRRFPFFGS